MSKFLNIKEKLNQERDDLIISSLYAELLHLNELLKDTFREKYHFGKLELSYICTSFMLGKDEPAIKLVSATLQFEQGKWDLKEMLSPSHTWIFSHFKSVTEQLINLNYGESLHQALSDYENIPQKGERKHIDMNKMVFSENEIEFANKKGFVKKIVAIEKDMDFCHLFLHKKNMHCALKVMLEIEKMEEEEALTKKRKFSQKLRSIT